MQIKFMKTRPDAVIPRKAHAADVGHDLVAVTKHQQRNCIRYGFGLAVDIPAGYAGLIFPRSSVFRTGMMMTNCVGVIDPGYTGEISALFWLEHEPSAKSYEVGDRVAQLVVVPVQEVEFVEVPELSQTERGANGYGSTGR